MRAAAAAARQQQQQQQQQGSKGSGAARDNGVSHSCMQAHVHNPTPLKNGLGVGVLGPRHISESHMPLNPLLTCSARKLGRRVMRKRRRPARMSSLTCSMGRETRRE